MMTKKTKSLSALQHQRWVCSASAIAISLTSFGLTGAIAQDDADDIFDSGDTVVVTGSNIRRKRDFETPSPVQTVGPTEIDNAGAIVVQDIFKSITANSGSQIANRQNALQGVSQFSLRGLGIGSTLTLINGRRAGLSPVSDDTGQLFTDVNAFPVNMIERIEVLTDGASATYGSEAVAGVINVITRNNFDGLEFTGEYRTSTHDSYQLGGAFGQTFDRGSFSAFATYYTQGGNFRSEIDIIREADEINPTDGVPLGGEFNSGTGSPGRFLRADVDADGNNIIADGSNQIADPNCVAAGGILRGTSCRYNFIDQRRIIAEEDRFQAFTQFNYDLTDKLKFSSELSYSRNEIRDALGGAVLRGDVNVTAPGGFVVPGDHPFNFFIDDGTGSGIVYAGPEAFLADPSLEAVDVIFQGRPLGSAYDGPCSGDDDILCAEDIVTVFNNLRFNSAFDYEINDSWFVNAAYTYSNNSYTRQQPRDYDGGLFQAALDNGTFNPFGTSIVTPNLVGRDGVSLAGNTQAAIDSFSTTINEVGQVTQEVIDFVISGDTGFALGNSDTIAVAFGAQYRELGFEFTPDGRRQSGNNGRGETEAAIPETTQDVYAFFGEAIIPVTDRLEIQTAVRFEDYGDQGGDTVDPKVSAKFDVTDSFALRGSWGTSFQAPSIRQVAGAVGSAGVTDPLDPLGGSFNVTVFTSGSPDLTSQSATNYNIGAILNTDFGLQMTVDYWIYEYGDLILPGGSAQSIIDADPNGPSVLRDQVGQLNAVFTGFENRGNATANGIDIKAIYSPDWWTFGDIAFDASTTIVTEFTSSEFEGLDGNGDLLGSRNNGNAFGSTPDFKINGGATLVNGPHTANVSIRHIGSYDDDQAGNPIDSQTTVDLRYAIDLESFVGEGTTLSIGAVNVFDEDAPRIEERPLFDTEVHDPRGRQFYVNFTQSF